MGGWQKLIDSQGNRCSICNKPFANESETRVDHDHKTKKIRGILCNKCNIGLGLFLESVEILKKAIDYLEKKPG